MVQKFLTVDEISARVEAFANQRTGVIAPSQELAHGNGELDLSVYETGVTHVERLSPLIQNFAQDALRLSGAGGSLDQRIARTRSFCEALERYCNVVPANPDMLVATRRELGDSAVDLELFPRCTKAEYELPGNQLVPPSNSAKLRWVPGLSLISGKQQFVPAAAVYVGLQRQYPGEAFSVPISTGTALAASYEQATIAGLCEAIERDALMISWLHQLPVPQVDVRSLHSDAEYSERAARMEQAGLQQHYFDVTSDLGVATLFGLQIAPRAPLHALVMTATRLNPLELPTKLIDEAAPARLGFKAVMQKPRSADPSNYATFMRLVDGALLYSDPAQMAAFDFLYANPEPRPIAALPNLSDASPSIELARLVEIFRQRQLELIVVDLTLPFLRDLGLYAVKVIAPQLMPMSPNYNARFLDTPRLYAAPTAMGYRARPLAELNPWPQPLA